MKKRIFSLFLVLVMSLSFSVFASTEESMDFEEMEYAEQLQRAKEIAYLDVDAATPEMKEKILEAREIIIYSTGWVADGYYGYIQDAETGEIIKVQPKFSELFPGWDIPVQEVNALDDSSISEIPNGISEDDSSDIVLLAAKWVKLVTKSYYLNVASSTQNTDPFAVVTADPYKVGSCIRAKAIALGASETYNIGMSNYDTGESYGYEPNLTLNQPYTVYVGSSGPRVAVRASTYSNPGWSTMVVEGSCRREDVR